MTSCEAHIEKRSDLGKDVQDNDRVTLPTARNKGKEPVVSNDVDTLADGELSSGSSLSLSFPSPKNPWEGAKAK